MTAADSWIAVDLMSGDRGPGVVVEACKHWLQQPDSTDGLLLVGTPDVLKGLPTVLTGHERVRLHQAEAVVSMQEKPSRALRRGQQTSLWQALALQAEGAAQATVSAGNTGALMAISRHLLKMLPGVDRPAICTALPSVHGTTWMLDMGANVDVSAEHLFQFAVMGNALAGFLSGKPEPRLALLNIGQEEVKGNDAIKRAAQLLRESGLNYLGYVEADGIFLDRVDVVVCDGFAGNVALKASEGAMRMLEQELQKHCKQRLISRFAAWLGAPVINRLRREFDPRRHNGASLLGLNGIVVKSHGNADTLAFLKALETAASEMRHAVPDAIRDQLAERLTQDETT